MKENATPKQIQVIHIAIAELGIEDEDYRADMNARFRVTSSKKLSKQQAKELIDDLKKRGFKLKGKPAPRKPRKPKADNVIGVITPGQHRIIAALVAAIHWRTENGFQNWCESSFGFRKPNTVKQAQQAIEGLKAMLARQAARKEA